MQPRECLSSCLSVFRCKKWTTGQQDITIFTCSVAVRSMGAIHSPSGVRPSSFHQFFQYICDMYGILRTLGHLDILTFVSCDFLGNATSQEMWLPGKCDFPGNVTSWKMWLLDFRVSRIYGFHWFMDFTYLWISRIFGFGFCWCLPEKCDLPEYATSQEKADFPGNVTS